MNRIISLLLAVLFISYTPPNRGECRRNCGGGSGTRINEVNYESNYL